MSVIKEHGMNKTEIRKSLEKQGCDFLSMNQLADAMQLDRGTVRRMVDGLSFIRVGTKKLFYTADVAERLMQLREH